MSPHERELFDSLLQQVIDRLPRQVRDLMDEIPIIVEDFPSRKVLREMGIEYRDDLCGLYRGVPRTLPEHERGRPHSDQVLLYREGILSAALDHRGRLTEAALREQIRVTILHEYGHHFGLDEDDLEELGYG